MALHSLYNFFLFYTAAAELVGQPFFWTHILLAFLLIYAIMVSFSSLLHLPNTALMEVLRNMDYPHRIGFSILSERAKKLVMALNMKNESFRVLISNEVSITIHIKHTQFIFFNFVVEENQAEMVEESVINLPIVDYVRVIHYQEGEHDYEWKIDGFGIRYWINHLLAIYHHSTIDCLYFALGGDRYDIQWVHNLFKDSSCIQICRLCSEAYSRTIMEKFLLSKRLVLQKNPFQNREDIHSIFMQNFDAIELYDVFSHKWPQFGIDDLLTMNSSCITLHSSLLSNEKLNGFIKLWIKGSNMRLKHLDISFIATLFLNVNIILKEVNSQVISNEQEIIINEFVRMLRRHDTVEGGFNIKRKDGKNAAIFIENYPIPRMKMFVWHNM